MTSEAVLTFAQSVSSLEELEEFKFHIPFTGQHARGTHRIKEGGMFYFCESLKPMKKLKKLDFSFEAQ